MQSSICLRFLVYFYPHSFSPFLVPILQNFIEDFWIQRRMQHVPTAKQTWNWRLYPGTTNKGISFIFWTFFKCPFLNMYIQKKLPTFNVLWKNIFKQKTRIYTYLSFETIIRDTFKTSHWAIKNSDIPFWYY